MRYGMYGANRPQRRISEEGVVRTDVLERKTPPWHDRSPDADVSSAGIPPPKGGSMRRRNAVDFDFYLRLSRWGCQIAVHHLSYQYRHQGDENIKRRKSRTSLLDTHRVLNSLVRMGWPKIHHHSLRQTSRTRILVIEFHLESEEPKPINSILPEPPSQRKERSRIV